MRPNAQPVRNNIAMAMALETRKASQAFFMNRNGITTGKVDRNTSRKTPSAPSHSSFSSRARSGGSGPSLRRWRMVSSSSGFRMDETTGGSALAMSRCAFWGSVALRTARKVRRPLPFSARQPIRYRTPSMIPQARLHPSAPMSIVRISSRPASAMLSEPVNVRTMISPNSTSETRS